MVAFKLKITPPLQGLVARQGTRRRAPEDFPRRFGAHNVAEALRGGLPGGLLSLWSGPLVSGVVY